MSSLTTPLMANETTLSRQEQYSALLNKQQATPIKFRRHSSVLLLNATEFIIAKAKDSTKILLRINTKDLVGAYVKGKDEKNNKKLEVFYYPLSRGCCTSHKEGNVRIRKMILLDFQTDQTACQNWKSVLRYAASGLALPELQNSVEKTEAADAAGAPVALRVVPAPKRRFLVVVNPVSGKRQGRRIWLKTVEPMLHEGSVTFTALITEYANHAKDFVSGMAEDPSTLYDAILCVGGDGVVYEVINGLTERAEGADLLRKLPVVHIPGGTGNGLAKSVLFGCHEACTPRNATFVAIKGRPHALDLARMTTKDGKSHISFLSLAWGLVSDVDILSETMRYLGESRLYIAAVYFMIRRRYYDGRLRMRLVEGQPVPAVTNARTDEDGWTTIESPFLLVWAVQTSHSGTTIHSGPGVRLDDGVFTVAVVQEMSRFEMIELLLGIDSGAHVKHPKVKIIKCTEYTLEPLTEKGIFSLDGEVIPYGLVEAKMLPSAACVLSL